MKKFGYFIVIAVALTLSFAFSNRNYSADDSDQFSYAQIGETSEVTVSAATGAVLSGVITIPDSIMISDATYSVTRVNADGFKDQTGITEVKLPVSLERIGNNAFKGCEGLQKITLPDTIERIGTSVFEGCISLNEVKLPVNPGLIRVSDTMFYNCTALTEINIPENITDIGISAFNMCRSLRKINFSGNIAKIETNAFAMCIDLILIFGNENQMTPDLDADAFQSDGTANIFFSNRNTYDNVIGDPDWKTYVSRTFIAIKFVSMGSAEIDYRPNATLYNDPKPDQYLFEFLDGTPANSYISRIGREEGFNAGVYKYKPSDSVTTDTSNYKVLPGAETESTLTINKIIPTITLPVYGDLLFGQDVKQIKILSSGSSNGTFKFDTGGTLSIGTHNLALTFIPNDGINYYNVTREVEINVIQLYVTFRDEISEDRIINVTYGNSIAVSEIPYITKRSGYTGKWNTDNFDDITDFLVIKAYYTLDAPRIDFLLDGKNNFSITYDGKDHILTADISHAINCTYEVSWEKNGDIVTDPSLKNAGTTIYTVRVKAKNGTDESAEAVKEIEVNILKAVVGIRATDVHIIKGDDFELGYEVTKGTVFAGDTASGSLTANHQNNTGSFDIELGTLSLGDNYQITFQKGKLNVLEPITIEIISITSGSIEFKAMDGVEYSINGGKLFTGDCHFLHLMPDRIYEVHARYAGLDGLGLTEMIEVKTSASIVSVSFLAFTGIFLLIDAGLSLFMIDLLRGRRLKKQDESKEKQ